MLLDIFECRALRVCCLIIRASFTRIFEVHRQHPAPTVTQTSGFEFTIKCYRLHYARATEAGTLQNDSYLLGTIRTLTADPNIPLLSESLKHVCKREESC